MIEKRLSEERGKGEHGWLSSRHTFSFAGYRDPEHMGFRSLRVINEDRVAGGEGFPPHRHENMEIVSYVVSGALAHKDSTGEASVIRPGDVQVMSAGEGIEHSEYNGSTEEPVHFFQMWILPDKQGYAPRYQEARYDNAGAENSWQLLVAPDGTSGSALALRQDAFLYRTFLSPGNKLTFLADTARGYWLQVVEGEVLLGEHALATGDGAALTEEENFALQANSKSHILLLDLA